MSLITDLQPIEVWKYFDQILEIPRPSKDEGRIREFLIKFAKEHSLKYKQDSAGNLLITKEATKGQEKKKTVVLQSHLDMVGEKNSTTIHDFSKDPITPRIDGKWVKAADTTLGADCGIGIAAQMAILSSSTIEHGKIECLFTVDEETGLTGAHALDKDLITGDILLNLDSEDEGELFIGCAGGIDTLAQFKYQTRIYPNRHKTFSIDIKGLAGGHSGDEIHKSPGGNSNKIISRFLWNADKKFDIRISTIDGGNLRNAIPREAKAVFAIHENKVSDLKKYFNQFKQDVFNELQHTEKNLSIEMEETAVEETVINPKTQKRLLQALHSCPNGVIKWSHDIDGLVETSTNLASVKFVKKQKILVTTSQRSSLDSAIIDISSRIEALFSMTKAKVWHTDGYPGWTPNRNSEIVKITEEAYSDLFSIKPVIRAIHAGLECGLFLKKYPQLDMISFGPTIKGAHSPDERLNIETTAKFWDLLLEVIKRIPDKS